MLYRLGLPIFLREGPCNSCGAPSDTYADHALICPSHGERISRHNHLRDALYHTAVSASLGPTKEDRALLPGVEARPADVYVPMWAPGGRDAALDVCIVSPFQQATLHRAAREPGYALEMRKQQKIRKYADACSAEGISFFALPVETTGGWEEGAAVIIKKLGQSLARATGQEEGDVIKHLFGKLSILLMKSNASMILNRQSVHPEPSINGVF